jgi:molybdopterin/thiamine biosynthesis adenylyltransferase
MTTNEATRGFVSSPDAQAGSGEWSYDEAFSRQRGLIDPDEQQRLRRCRVAIVGMGGVGGVHLATLARLGIGSFHIADPDCFELANFNRQYGATTDSLGRGKAEVMAEKVQAINPEVKVRVFAEAITAANVGEFLEGVDVLVDGIDFFSIEARRLLFQEARRRGIWAVTAGPIGFSTAWLVFSPEGMSFDDYFDLHDGMERLDQLVAFAVGLTPRATHLGYLDLSQVDPSTGRGPSAGLACQLCSGVAAAEVVKILLHRSPVSPAPCYSQFDAYRQVFRKGRLRWGNRHPLQRLKRWWLRRRLQRMLGTKLQPVAGSLPEPQVAAATF